MKYLLDWTGNPIYPFWQNFLATGKGDWFVDRPLTPKQWLYTRISQGILVATVVAGLWVWRRRPRGRWLWWFGLMNLGFVSFMLGFAAYRQSWLDRIWVDRLWNWPQMFLGAVLAILMLGWLPRRYTWWRKLRLGWLGLLGVVAGSQLLWLVIVNNMGFVPWKWSFFKPLAKAVASEYQGGRILLPEVADFLSYGLYKNGIEGKNFVGQMFGPFHYMEEEPFVNWQENRQIMADFLRDNNIKLVVNEPEGKYLQLMKKEPSWFTLLGVLGADREYKKIEKGESIGWRDYYFQGYMSIWQVSLPDKI
jgi:hypothetical protein